MNQYCTILTAILPEDQDNQQQESIIDPKRTTYGHVPEESLLQSSPEVRSLNNSDPERESATSFSHGK